MKLRAKLYIGLVLCAGLCTWLVGSLNLGTAKLAQFLFYCFLAVLSSGMKVRLPGITGAMSVNYVFILLSIVDLSLGQTIAVALCGALAQSLLFFERRPQPVQIAFNAAAISVCALAGFQVYHWRFVQAVDQSLPILLGFTAVAYFLLNTITIAGIISMTEGKALVKIWKDNFYWTAPHYLFGACLAALLSACNRQFGWQYSVLVMPGVYLLYRSYHLYLGRLEEEKKHVAEVADLHLRTIEALALAIEAKDDTTHSHLRRVQVYAIEIARELGLPYEEIRALEAAALLHDIGKLAVPEYIINKPGRLTKEEFEKMKVHPLVGAEILECVQFPYPVVPIVRSHHEKWDGSGYPDGLKGEAIPIGARILSVVDCLDALASDRQYRRALPLDKALAEVVGMSGKAYDPQVVSILKNRFPELEKKVRSATALSAGRLSTRAKISRGDAPAAGLAAPASGSGAALPAEERMGFIGSIAAARQEFQKLHEFTRDIGNSLSLDDTLTLVSSRMKTLLAYDTIAIYCAEGQKLVPHHVSGVDAELFSSLAIPSGEGITGWVADNKQPMLNGNPSVEMGYLRDATKFTLLRSALAVPLEGVNGLAGVLTVYRREAEGFSGDDLRVMLAVASKVAMTIENARTYHAAEKSAETDKLTGLANGHSFVVQLEEELQKARAEKSSVAVLVIDLDGFKQVNDTLGHLEGNRVLQLVADGMRRMCRDNDLVARMGGDEFAVLFPGMTASGIQEKVVRFEQLMRDVDKTVSAGGVLGLSSGPAFYPEDGSNPEALLGAADQRMYQVKRTHHAATPRLIRAQPATQVVSLTVH